MKATTGMRLGLGDLVAAGRRAVSGYTGTLFSVFIVQSLLAAACMLAVAFVLAQRFSHLPMFDEAVDGDLVALIYSLRYGESSFLAVGGIVFATLLVWELVTWFLVGGIFGVLAHRPESRGDTARIFGASGVTTYLAYARLALCSLFGWSIVLTVFQVSWAYAVAPRIEYALTIGELVGPLAIAFVPAGLLLHFFWTVTDYARAELFLRHETHSPGVLATYVRTMVYVARRPLTLLHGAIGWVLAILITLAYAFIAQGHPMYGAEGAIMLFVLRQIVALFRMAIRMGIMGGQLELARTRPHPPRRADPATKPVED